MAAIFFLVVIGFTACEKPEESLGIDLQPSEDLISVIGSDTFTVKAYSLPEDSIRTEEVTPGMVGAYIDPVFGLAKAGHYTELRLTTANPTFPTDGQLEGFFIDSLILNLAFQNIEGIPVYGGTDEQFFQVFEVDDTLALGQSHFGDERLEIFEEDLVEPGFNLVQPNYRDSVVIDSISARSAIRLHLKTDIAERIVEASIDGGLTAEEFDELIDGLYITVDENAAEVNLSNTGIIYFDTFSGASRLEMYYRDTIPEEPITDFYDFQIRSNTGKFNAFEHEFTRGGSPALIRQVVDSVIDAGNQKVFIQAMSGTKVRIDLPYIETLRDSGNLAISKAELILPVEEGSIGRFAPPAGLFIFGLDENGDAFFLDDQLDGSTFIGGDYDPVNQEYRFLISRYLQQVLAGDREFHGLEVVTERASFTANRAILNGPEFEGSNKKIKLRISFSKY